jgi:ribosomal protein S18 acetylase RimI-like enzyme
VSLSPAGVEVLYVHTMAVNEAALRFYRQHGFEIEKEESSNAAHYRGHCLDGIEGAGRTVLLRDTELFQSIQGALGA